MTEAFVGMGANLGDAAQTLASAAHRISALPKTGLESQSSIYRSAPIDAAGPDFLNCVIKIRTGLGADELLAALLAIEQEFGRARPYRNAPRTLDLDLLLFGNQRIETAALTVPHPRMHLRAFVLEPLAQIAPDIELPGLPALATLRAACRDQRLTRIEFTAVDPAPASALIQPAIATQIQK